MKHVLSYRKGHPNPVQLREKYILLDGEWDFCFDEENKGVEDKYYLSFPKNCLTINVPYAYQSLNSGINKPDYICNTIWYRKKLNIIDTSKTYLLHFLGIDYECEIFVNGELVYKHIGGYDSFDVPLNKLVMGNNELVVRVFDDCDPDQLRGKQSWRKHNFTCFYTRVSGIHKSVYLDVVEDNYISYFSLNGDYVKKEIYCHIELNKKCDSKVRISIGIKQYLFDCKDIKNDFVIKYDDCEPWEPLTTPKLYDAILELIINDNIKDIILTYFGFKSILCKDGHFYINNKDVYLKLVLNQGYFKNGLTTYSEREVIEDLSLIVDCGFNGFRMHQHVPDPLLFYYADLLGLLVWQEVPSAAYYSYKTNFNCFREIPNQIRDHFSHPCIMAYTLFNESWGINEIKESKEIQDFTVEIVNMVRKVSRDRLLISNDGWYHTTSDILTIHHYGHSYEDLEKDLPINLLDVLKNGKNPETIKNFVHAYAGQYRYHGEPIMLSEFFGLAYEKDHSKDNWGYGNCAKDEKEYISVLTDQLDYIKTHSYYRGFCLTQFSDVQQEVNGLFNYDREPKCDIKKVKDLMGQFK